MHVALDHSLSSLCRDGTYSQQEQVYYPSRTLYVAPSGYSPDGEDALQPSQTNPPLTRRCQYDIHLLSRSTRSSTLIRPQETFEALESTPHAGHVVGVVENPEAFAPADAHYHPDSLGQPHSAWNVHGVEVAGSFNAHPPHLVEGHGRSPTVPFCKPPPPYAHSFPINDFVHIGAPTLTMEHGPSTVGGHRGHREQPTFYDPNDFRFSPSAHPPTGRLSAPACPQRLLDITDRTATNVGTAPPSTYYTPSQSGHAGNYQWVGGNERGYGNAAPSFPCSNEPRHQQPHSLHPVHHHDNGNLSMHGASPEAEADHSHIGPSKDAPAADVAFGQCGWRDTDGKECGELLTYPGNLASHFADCHGIRKMASDVLIMCRWCSPEEIVKRESIVRHLREHHLGYRRRKKGVAQPSLQFPSATRSPGSSNASTRVESPTFIFHYPPHGPSPTHTRPPRSCDFPTTSFPVNISPGWTPSWNQNG
ncbi:hypothetical protein EDD15DRAFT_2364147 [Pisolithus albus]|nr:hypothetical protein EDD15DRAFT_2364147 [Pisolithus albus]